MATYSVESENGQAMSEGIQSEDEARRIAQNHANELGETVYLCRSSGGATEAIAPDATGDLCDYDTAEVIRESTAAERADSVRAARRDGGAGVISVDGRRCYVQD